MERDRSKRLEAAYEASTDDCPFPALAFIQSGTDSRRLRPRPHRHRRGNPDADALAARSTGPAPPFHPHPKLERLLNKRNERVQEGHGLDWANAEALALASMLAENIPIRLSGQDSGRGTFSQRHSILYDIKSGEPYVP